MRVRAEQCVDAAQDKAARALPPVSAEPSSEVTHCVVVELSSVLQEEGALVAVLYLYAFMRSLKI